MSVEGSFQRPARGKRALYGNTVNVYSALSPGADASFLLYEDDGISFDFWQPAKPHDVTPIPDQSAKRRHLVAVEPLATVGPAAGDPWLLSQPLHASRAAGNTGPCPTTAVDPSNAGCRAGRFAPAY